MEDDSEGGLGWDDKKKRRLDGHGWDEKEGEPRWKKELSFIVHLWSGIMTWKLTIDR